MFYTVKEMQKQDIKDVMKIERESFHIPWSKEAFLNLLQSQNTLCLVATTTEDNSIAGFICLRYVLDEAEILEFAVKCSLRRRGIGWTLLNEALKKLKASGVTTVYLEVRPSNTAALALYKKAGFQQTAIRRDYYFEPREDAILMKLSLKEL